MSQLVSFLDVLSIDQRKVYEQQRKLFFEQIQALNLLSVHDLEKIEEFQKIIYVFQNQQFFANLKEDEQQQIVQIVQKVTDFILNSEVLRERKQCLIETFKKIKLDKKITKQIKVDIEQVKKIYSGKNHKNLNFLESVKYDLHIAEISKFLKIIKKRLNMVEFIYDQFEIQINQKLQFFSDFCEIKYCDLNQLRLIQKIFTSLGFKKILNVLNLFEKMIMNKNFQFDHFYEIILEKIFKNFIDQYDKNKVQPNTFNKIFKIITTILNLKNEIEEEHLTKIQDNMINYLQIFIDRFRVNVKKSYQDQKLIKEFNQGVIYLIKNVYAKDTKFPKKYQDFIQKFLLDYFINVVITNKLEHTYFQELCFYYFKYQKQVLDIFLDQYFQSLLDNKDISNSLILNLSNYLVKQIIEKPNNESQINQIQDKVDKLIQKEKSCLQLRIAQLKFNIFKNQIKKVNNNDQKKEMYLQFVRQNIKNSHIFYFNDYLELNLFADVQFTQDEQSQLLQDIVSEYQQDLQFSDLKKCKLFSDGKFLKNFLQIVFKNNIEQFLSVLKKIDSEFDQIEQNFIKNKKQQAIIKLFGLFPLKDKNNYHLIYDISFKIIYSFLDNKNPDLYYISEYLFYRLIKIANKDKQLNEKLQNLVRQQLENLQQKKDFNTILNSHEFSILNYYTFPSSGQNLIKNDQICDQYIDSQKQILQNNNEKTFSPYQYQVMNQKMIFLNNLDQQDKVLQYFQKQMWEYQKFWEVNDERNSFQINIYQEQNILKKYFQSYNIDNDKTLKSLFKNSEVIQQWIMYNLYDLKLNLKPFFNQIFQLTSKGFLETTYIIQFYNNILKENLNQVEKLNLDNLSEVINSVTQIFTAQNLQKLQNKKDLVTNYCNCIRQLFNQEVDFQIKFELFITLMIFLFSIDFDQQNVSLIPYDQDDDFIQEFLFIFKNQHQIEALQQQFEKFLNNQTTFYTDFQKKILVNIYINFLSSYQQKDIEYQRLDQYKDLDNKIFLNLNYETFVYEKNYQTINLDINLKVIEKILNFLNDQLNMEQKPMQNFFQSFLMSSHKILQHFQIMNPLTMLLMKIICFLNQEKQREVINMFNKILEKDSSYNHLKVFLFYMIYYQRQKGILVQEADQFIYNFFDFLKQDFKSKNILNLFNNQYMYVFNIYMCPKFLQRLIENLISKNHNRYKLILLLFYFVVHENHFGNDKLKQQYRDAVLNIKCSQQNSQLFLIRSIQLFLKHYQIKEQVLELEKNKEDFNFQIIIDFIDKIDTNSSTMDYYFEIVEYYNDSKIAENSFKVLLKVLENFKKYFDKQPDQRQSYQLIQRFQNISFYFTNEQEKQYLTHIDEWMKSCNKLSEKLFCQTLVLNCNLKTIQDIQFLDQYETLMKNFDNQNKVQIFDQFESNVRKVFTMKSKYSFQQLLNWLQSSHFQSDEFQIHTLKGVLQSLQHVDLQTIKNYFDYCEQILDNMKDDQRNLILRIISQYQYLTNNQEIMQYQNKDIDFQSLVDQIYKYKSSMQYFS